MYHKGEIVAHIESNVEFMIEDFRLDLVKIKFQNGKYGWIPIEHIKPSRQTKLNAI